MLVKHWHKDGAQKKRRLAPQKKRSVVAKTKLLVNKLKVG